MAQLVNFNRMFDNKNKLKVAERLTLYRPEPKRLNIPDGVTVSNQTNELHIEIDWKKAGSKSTLLVVLLFNCVVSLLFYHNYLGSDYFSIGFIFFFFLVGLYFIYESITLIFNKTFITVQKDRLCVKHKPINFLAQKDQSILTKEIVQLFVNRQVRHHNYANPYGDWTVYLIRQGKVDIPLITGLKSISDAKFFEQLIEHYLNIANQSVKEEWKEED